MSFYPVTSSTLKIATHGRGSNGHETGGFIRGGQISIYEKTLSISGGIWAIPSEVRNTSPPLYILRRDGESETPSNHTPLKGCARCGRPTKPSFAARALNYKLFIFFSLSYFLFIYSKAIVFFSLVFFMGSHFVASLPLLIKKAVLTSSPSERGLIHWYQRLQSPWQEPQNQGRSPWRA